MKLSKTVLALFLGLGVQSEIGVEAIAVGRRMPKNTHSGPISNQKKLQNLMEKKFDNVDDYNEYDKFDKYDYGNKYDKFDAYDRSGYGKKYYSDGDSDGGESDYPEHADYSDSGDDSED